MKEPSTLFEARRLAEIRQLVTRWIALPDEQVGRLTVGLHYPIPASPDDVFWLCDQVERLARAVETADAAYSAAIDEIGRDLVAAQERALIAERTLGLSNGPFVRSGKRG